MTISKYVELTTLTKFPNSRFKLLFPSLIQQEEPTNLEKSMKYMIQSQNDFTQYIDRLEEKMNQLINTYRNEKTLPYQYLTSSDISNPINLAQESCYFEN